METKANRMGEGGGTNGRDVVTEGAKDGNEKRNERGSEDTGD